jgi:hypothetical protein
MNPTGPAHQPTRDPNRSVSHEQISARAEKLWRERNCPAGSDEAIWLEAESQLQAEAQAAPVSGTPSRPYVDEPARLVRNRTKVQDPADAGVQTRSATPPKSKKTERQVRSQ